MKCANFLGYSIRKIPEKLTYNDYVIQFTNSLMHVKRTLTFTTEKKIDICIMFSLFVDEILCVILLKEGE